MGCVSYFIGALFTAMYGLPLTIYLLTGALGSRFESLTLTHDGGHLWSDLIGWQGDPHVSPFHLASYLFIGGGMWAIFAAWRVLRSEEHTSDLQSLMRISYAVFCLQKKNKLTHSYTLIL